jgi:hypothetical protein
MSKALTASMRRVRRPARGPAAACARRSVVTATSGSTSSQAPPMQRETSNYDQNAAAAAKAFDPTHGGRETFDPHLASQARGREGEFNLRGYDPAERRSAPFGIRNVSIVVACAVVYSYLPALPGAHVDVAAAPAAER